MKTNQRRSIHLAASAVFALMLAMAAHGETDLKGGDAASNLQSLVYNVERPDNGPDWQVRFQFQFLFAK